MEVGSVRGRPSLFSGVEMDEQSINKVTRSRARQICDTCWPGTGPEKGSGRSQRARVSRQMVPPKAENAWAWACLPALPGACRALHPARPHPPASASA